MQNNIPRRLEALRRIMQRERLDAFYLSGTDPHMSEYLSDHWQTRRFISGFSGSYGEVVITPESAGLWTDTRYFIQAEEQLAGTGIRMHKLRVPEAVPVVQWLKLNLPPNARIGLDPYSMPLAAFRTFSEELSGLQPEFVFLPDLLDEIWENRPPLPGNPVFELEETITGESRAAKLQRIADATEARGAGCTVVTALDDLAWSFNLRGSDISYNPVFMGFALIGTGFRRLYAENGAVPENLREKLSAEGIGLHPYESVYRDLETLSGEKVLIDPSTVNTAIFEALRKNNQIIEGNSFPTLMKAVKNETELAGFREAMRQDGVAVVRFLHWLKENVGGGQVTEYTTGRKLAWFRAQQPGFRGESFSPIVGYGDHGAIVHLSVDEKTANRVKPEGVLLFDSGGQYSTGTTDITRTVAVGPVTPQMRRDFTLVLQGMIRLSMAVFPAGTKGVHLDILARQALWENGLNYGHGTGHGVGHFLNVHEGPASIRQEYNPQEILPGMVFSNEPGLYRQGEYGIRTENMMVCTEKETTPFGRFLGFETLTLCPIDTTLVIPEMLLPREKEWLNDYHVRVRESLMPLVPEELRGFLEELTQAV